MPLPRSESAPHGQRTLAASPKRPVLQVAGFNLANQGHVGHYTGEVRDLLVRSGLRPSLWLASLLLIFMLLMALRSLFNRMQSVLTLRTALTYELSLGRRLYQAIINA